MALLAFPEATAAPPPDATISGTVGENVSTTDHYDGRHLRYVGDPAPAGYGDYYQWGSPYILTTSPEVGPVTLTGTLDLSAMTQTNQVAVIGLHDADALRAGDRGDKAEVGIYVARRTESYRIGVTDGDTGGGEFVQVFRDIPVNSLDGGVVQVEFTVDGTADPASCASDPADVATMAACSGYCPRAARCCRRATFGTGSPSTPGPRRSPAGCPPRCPDGPRRRRCHCPVPVAGYP